MKFQKGLLDEINDAKVETPPATTPVEVEKNRLFQTVKEETGSERSYLKLLGIVAVFVLIGGGLLLYFMQPGVGDRIKAPTETEMALRDHFQLKEKRTATDIVFYQCDKYLWAHVDVEKRTDIKTNPVYAIDKYTARIEPAGESKFNITATPITDPSLDVPCK